MLSLLKKTLSAPSSTAGGLAKFRMYSAGFSLVELMISIVVGLVVLGGVVSIFASSIKANSDALKMTGLNQELRGLMDIMTRDIRRSGYWGTANTAIGATDAPNSNEFDALVISKYGAEAATSCITYKYDIDGDGAPDNDEYFGFRLNAKAVEMRRSDLSCTVGNWENVTDENSIEITQLLFTLLAQPPIVINSDGTGTGTSTLNVREVQISLAGRLKNDTSVTRSLQETVRIRTDRWSANLDGS